MNQNTPSHIFVGSTNPVKLNGTLQACQHIWPDVIVKGYSVPSGVAEQPRSDQETLDGAKNRAAAALKSGEKWLAESSKNTYSTLLGVGLEGGVFDHNGEVWSTVWAVVTDSSGQFWQVNGARFQVPEPIASIIASGQEMGPAVSKLTGESNLKQKQGMIGVITQGFLERTDEYQSLAKLALGLWYGRDWADQLA